EEARQKNQRVDNSKRRAKGQTHDQGHAVEGENEAKYPKGRQSDEEETRIAMRKHTCYLAKVDAESFQLSNFHAGNDSSGDWVVSGCESGRAQPHSMTLARCREPS